MRKINRMDIIRMMLVLTLVAGAGLALGSVGRFTPTHKIVEAVNCISCHPEQAEELSATTHLTHFAREAGQFYYDQYDALNGVMGDGDGYQMTDAEQITSGCTMCHNYWDNMKWFGVNYMDISLYDHDVPGAIYDNEPAVGTGSRAASQYIGPVDKVTDIYGNAVSNYGLGSTKAWVLKIGEVEPWEAGLDTYAVIDAGPDGLAGTADDLNLKRIDYVWSALSALSPGPVAFGVVDPGADAIYGTADDTVPEGCGTAEKGLCHISAESVALAARNQKAELSKAIDPGVDGVLGTADDNAGPDGVLGTADDSPGSFAHGAGVFFQHEMAYTTAQYAAKPVKLCGACHVFKLPPMVWGGEAWASRDIKYASSLIRAGSTDRTDIGEANALFTDVNVLNSPFGFRPGYNDNTGELHTYSGSGASREAFDIRYRTPDWAHMNVPCIRCHSHAGITGETVSSNK